MEKTNTHAEIEQMLMGHLSNSNLSKENLSNLSKSIAHANQLGFKLIDWWIYGIPAFENIVLQGQSPVSQGDSIFGNFSKNEIIKEMKILRKGIPRPDFFNIELTIQNTQRRQ